jgi:hypothetical protein
MKSAVLARPNLKFFVVSAVVMLALQHLFTNDPFQGQVSAALPDPRLEITDAQITTLLNQLKEVPSAAGYVRVSHAYERRGDYKRALQYLRRAEKLGLSEDEP